MYYLNSRYYNPTWGRFINIDSYGGEIGGNILSYNPYIYAINNPIIYKDTSGNIIALSWGAIVGIAVATIGIVTMAVDNLIGISTPVPNITLDNPFDKPLGVEFKEPEIVKEKTNIKVKPLPYPAKIEEYKPCTTATLGKGDVIRGERLTIAESQAHVKPWGNVMCDNRASAQTVASYFPRSYEDKIHGGGKTGYYPHFHPWDGWGHPHIWYFAEY